MSACQQRDVEVAVTSGVGIALECGTERWRNIVEAAKAPRFHCCLIRRSWGGNCLLEIFPLFHFPQPSVGENLKLTDWFLGKYLLKNQKLFVFLLCFLWLQGCRLFPVPRPLSCQVLSVFLRVFSGGVFLCWALSCPGFHSPRAAASPWLYVNPTFLNFPAPGVPEWQNEE